MSMMQTFKAIVLSSILLLVSSAGYAAQNLLDEQNWNYDPAVPTTQDVLGYAPGEQISSHHQIVTYIQALASSNPDRMRVLEYATSWEGRKLYYLVISSRRNITDLELHQATIQQLAQPGELGTDEIASLIKNLPATTWLAYGVHGDEISSSDAALQTAYHLLASRDDVLVDKILANTLVFIDPLQNPDGHDRFVNHFRLNRGLLPDDYPQAAERIQQWPGSRTNHYFFDLNRDWFAITQPETRGRIRILQEWYPLTFVDFHEMDLDSTYFFPPTAPPINPWSSARQVESFSLFGKNNAAWFDIYGIDYFTRETFDYFYPGYGDSWPGYYGSIGMTYEQSSARGLIARRLNGSVLSFRQSVRNHFITSLATLETAAKNRVRLYEDFMDYRHSAIEQGKQGVRNYILPMRGDTSLVHKLAGMLASQGITVKKADEAFKTCGDFPAGSYVIPLDQPSNRLIHVLLDASVEMEPEFIKEQERRRATWVGHELYDVTAWSIPLMFNVEAVPCSKNLRTTLASVTDFDIPGQLVNPDAKVAFIVPWGTNAAGRFLTAGLKANLHILSNDKPFTLAGREFPAGSLIFKVADNPVDLVPTLRGIAQSSGADVVGTDTSWVEQGVNFGSQYVSKLKPIRIAMLWEAPTLPYSTGATRFVLEQQFNYPVTVVPVRKVLTADLSMFDVVIMPAGKYSMKPLEAKLLNWVIEGGTLIALEKAVSSISSTRLLDIKEEYLAASNANGNKKDKKDKKDKKKIKNGKEKIAKGSILASKEDYLTAIKPEKEKPDSVPGVLLRAEVDRDHWLSSGLPDTVNVLFNGNRIYTPITLDKGVNVLRYPAAKELLASGYLWQENRQQIAFKPFVVTQKHSKGIVIAFTSSPTTRAYQDGLNLLLLNAVFRGPAHTR